MLLLFGCSVVSNSLRPQGLQHVGLLFPSPSPGVCSNSRPLTQQCYLTMSSFTTTLSFFLQSFPASGASPKSWLFLSSGQSIGTSAPALPVNMQGWFPLGLTVLLSLLPKGLSRVFSSTTVRKYQFFSIPPSLWSTLTSVHDYWKNHSFDYMNLCWQIDSLLFNTLYRLVKSFLPRSRCLLISWL